MAHIWKQIWSCVAGNASNGRPKAQQVDRKLCAVVSKSNLDDLSLTLNLTALDKATSMDLVFLDH